MVGVSLAIMSRGICADEPVASSRPADAAPSDISEFEFAGFKAGDTRADNELGLQLVWCPPGTFVMGSRPGEDEYRTNERQVETTLSRGFWIDPEV